MKGVHSSLSAVPEGGDDLDPESDDQEDEDEIHAFSKHLGMDPSQDAVCCCNQSQFYTDKTLHTMSWPFNNATATLVAGKQSCTSLHAVLFFLATALPGLILDLPPCIKSPCPRRLDSPRRRRDARCCSVTPGVAA